MKQFEEQDIEQLLRSVDVRPDPKWQSRVIGELDQLAQTDKEEARLYIDSPIQEKKADFLSVFAKEFNMFTKKAALIAAGVVLFVVAGSTGLVMASDDAKPGDVLYGVDRGVERVQLAIAQLKGNLAVADKYLDHADERLDELEQIASSSAYVFGIPIAYADDTMEDPLEVEDLIVAYEEAIKHAIEYAQKADSEGKNIEDLMENMAKATLHHERVLADVLEKVPLQAREAVGHAMDVGMNGHREALRAVSGEKQAQIQNELKGSQAELEDDLERLRRGGYNVPSFEDDNDGEYEYQYQHEREGEGDQYQEQHQQQVGKNDEDEGEDDDEDSDDMNQEQNREDEGVDAPGDQDRLRDQDQDGEGSDTGEQNGREEEDDDDEDEDQGQNGYGPGNS